MENKHQYEWTEDRSGKLSMSAEISGLGADAGARKRVMAHLIPNTGKDVQGKGWYITDIERNFLDAGHGGVDVRNAAEGKAFLEKWGDNVAMPELERLRSNGAQRKHEQGEKLTPEQKAWAKFQEQQKGADHEQDSLRKERER